MVHLHCNEYSPKDESCETTKTSRGHYVSFSYLNFSKTLQWYIWTHLDTEKRTEYCIISISSMKTVVIVELVASSNYAHQVMHECAMKLFHIEMGGKINLTINRFLHQTNNGTDKQIIKCYDKILALQNKTAT